jgi:hypothetical protein
VWIFTTENTESTDASVLSVFSVVKQKAWAFAWMSGQRESKRQRAPIDQIAALS